MLATYNTHAPKKTTSLTVNADLLQKAKAYKINLSQSFEKHLDTLIRKKAEQAWLKENQKGIEERNNFVEEHGVFSDGLRTF